MFHVTGAAVPIVLGVALAVAAAGPGAAFNSDRASWINYLQEQRAARQADRPAPARPAARGFHPPETGVVRPGVQRVVQRPAATPPAAPQTTVRQTSLNSVARRMDPQFLPQTVRYDGPHKPGTIVIDTSDLSIDAAIEMALSAVESRRS